MGALTPAAGKEVMSKQQARISEEGCVFEATEVKVPVVRVLNWISPHAWLLRGFTDS